MSTRLIVLLAFGRIESRSSGFGLCLWLEKIAFQVITKALLERCKLRPKSLFADRHVSAVIHR